MPLNSLAFRLAASAAIWCALVLSAGGYALSVVFADNVERGFDARLAVLLEGLIAASEIEPAGALVLRPQAGEPRFAQPLSGWYWQISDGAQPVERSASLWDETLEVTLPAGDAAAILEVAGPAGQSLRVLVRAITLPGRTRPLLYAVAGDRAEIAGEQLRFTRLLGLALGALFLGLVLAVLIQVRFGLEPLRGVSRGLASIRAGRARRLDGTFPSEIRPLVVELNALLEHSEALIARARTHVGNLAHGLKTPIAVLHNEAERAPGPLADVVRRQVAQMRRQVDHHLARARAITSGSVLGARSEVGPAVGDLRRTLLRIYAAKQLALEVTCPEGLVFAGARQDLEEMLGNLLDNACKWAERRVRVTCEQVGSRLRLAFEDDGPGLPPDREAEVIERGRRLDETKPGSGLGLAIVAEMVELYGGTLRLEPSPLGGLAVRLDLPAAPALPVST